jgi:hypothetical protein
MNIFYELVRENDTDCFDVDLQEIILEIALNHNWAVQDVHFRWINHTNICMTINSDFYVIEFISGCAFLSKDESIRFILVFPIIISTLQPFTGFGKRNK